jgi:2-oxoglutarate dehydrogenase E1 component
MTSPQLYETIRGLVPVTTAFEQELISGGNSEQVMRVKEELNVMYHAAKHFKGGEEPHTHYACQLEDDGTGIWSGTSHLGQTTSISKDLLQKAGKALVAHPDSFTFHPIVEKTINTRRKSLESDDGKVDWATAELLALSSLATEGIPVRLSGEDSERGTFTQRHAVWHDATTGKEYHAMPNQMEIANSPLSELSVVGFEFGWSLWNPNSLVCWEAQFGDFADEAQVIFDTMISSSVSRWGIESNIVLLLPHGCK